MKKLILFLAILCAAPAYAANAVFLANAAAGANDGSSCANAKAGVTYFNNSANWSATPTGIQIGPDTTVHLCGAFTGPTGASFFSIQGSGTSGHPVIILFETGASISAPNFTFFGGAFNGGAHSYITIDGGSNGVISNTDNGSAGAFANSTGGRSIEFDGPSTGITVKNLTIANICQHTLATDPTACNTGGNGTTAIYFTGGASSIRITQNTIHDVENAISYTGATGDTTVEIDHNTISRVNWGMALASIGPSSGLNVHDNDITCVVASPCNWNDNANSFHHNGMIIFPQAAPDIMSNMIVANNFIHDFNTATGGIFIDPALGNTPNAAIFNNVFFTTAGQVGPSNAWITVGIGATGVIAVNNTVIGPSAEGISGQLTPTTKNNIFSGGGSMLGYLLNSGYSGVSSDFNDWFNLTPGQAMAAGFCCQATVADWVTLTGFDTHSITSNPNLTSGFVPNAGSLVIGAGANLTSLCSTTPGICIDAPQTFGVGGTCGTGCTARPASGPWTIGARNASGSGTSVPTVPTGVLPLVTTISFSLTVSPSTSPLVINTSSLPQAKVSSPYSAAISVSGGTLPYICKISSGSLPNGLGVSSTNSGCNLAGTPTQSGTFSFTLQVTDSSVALATRKERLTAKR